jgi:hypothetical protein
MTLDERLKALTIRLKRMNRKALSPDERIELLLTEGNQDGEKIRALARVAEARLQRRTNIKDGPRA